jgi:hypothetical protein
MCDNADNSKEVCTVLPLQDTTSTHKRTLSAGKEPRKSPKAVSKCEFCENVDAMWYCTIDDISSSESNVTRDVYVCHVCEKKRCDTCMCDEVLDFEQEDIYFVNVFYTKEMVDGESTIVSKPDDRGFYHEECLNGGEGGFCTRCRIATDHPGIRKALFDNCQSGFCNGCHLSEHCDCDPCVTCGYVVCRCGNTSDECSDDECDDEDDEEDEEDDEDDEDEEQ